MENLKHTPGKWYQSHRQIPNDEDGNYSTQVYTEDGETIATIHWYPMPPQIEIIDGKQVRVIRTYRQSNAKLIAAAPELLEALQGICNILEITSLSNKPTFKEDFMIAQSAIKKAIGE